MEFFPQFMVSTAHYRARVAESGSEVGVLLVLLIGSVNAAATSDLRLACHGAVALGRL